jgi:hypothetical protein
LPVADVTDWETSGVSGNAYCKQQSLTYHQFFYWRRKLAPTEDCAISLGFTLAVSGLFFM